MSGENRKLFSVDSHVYIPPEAIRKHVASTKLDAFDEAVKAVLQSGFALVGSSEVLDNPADDHTVGPFDESLGRNTDRIVLKFMKL